MRRILAIAVVLTVFLPSIAFARTQYLCGMDGERRDQCCCPPDQDQDQDPAPVQTVTRGSCCTVMPAHQAASSPAIASASWELPGTPPMAATPLALPPPPVAGPVTVVATRGCGPPASHASLFVQHCALLL